ncbi:CRISPR-associated endonuclease Cas2 [Thiomicrospira sp. R3]|uniref:CRISPR-associated endonuclease Cas2 n=1 Tax=Thiomicrospira sp. R3 TaxID=3035472 RepID=UPI00259BBFB3|nr:CRISPR-associated endonuclease Cas2 [Thiomicrospira sp. R3]WFE69481.1 CRISPR-associated endonuclease Cas2 [Thiomicrospira sp. R3]
MKKKAHWHILAYDIKNPKRLQRVHKYIKKFGLALQKSVYLVLASEQRMETIMAELASLINPKLDDVRTYPIESAQTLWLYGSSLHESLLMDQDAKANAWQRTKQWLEIKNNQQTQIPEALLKGIDHAKKPELE